jgi:histidyl-tRNA synthetase
MRAQLRYADKRGAPVVVIEGGNERARGEVTLKDMALGEEIAGAIKSREEWTKGGAAQIAVKREALVPQVQQMLARTK